MNRVALTILASTFMVCSSSSLGQDALPAWDGLVDVKAGRLDLTFVAPGADFRPYKAVLIEPVQSTYRKDWMKNMNDTRSGARTVTEADAEGIAALLRSNFAEVLAEAYTHAGLTVAASPAPGTLRVSGALVNMYVNAPEALLERSRMESAALAAGQATLVIELRDATTGALVRRIMDNRETRGVIGEQLATKAANVADFRRLFKNWADECVKDLESLQRMSPLPASIKSGRELY